MLAREPPPSGERPARFLRVITPVPLPDPDVYEIPRYAAGVTGAFGFREILGYVPVEPDGSVTANIPARRPFSFDILNLRGRSIGPRHNYWLQLAPGEVLECGGCHDHASGQPHGLVDSRPTPANPGARGIAGGVTGFPATDSERLFAEASGATMAQTWDFHMPADNPAAPARALDTAPTYVDAWSGQQVNPEAPIMDREYAADWTDIPPERAILTRGFDATQPPRSVINYIDHIQPIWERVRTPVTDTAGTEHEYCTSCHISADAALVPAGQLDLGRSPSDIDPDHYRSYRELLSSDNEQWIDAGGALADRQRTCTELNEDGDTVTTVLSLPMPATLRAGSANASSAFFRCFEGGSCGPADTPALPANCVEDAGEPVPATRNTVNHVGLLSEAELHLISEWLDLGAQYFNNPFDSRLQD